MRLRPSLKFANLSLLGLLLLSMGMSLTSCSSEREDPFQEKNSQPGDTHFPHPDIWSSSHTSFVAGSLGSEREETLRQCQSCHAVRPEARALSQTISCGSTCHASSASVVERISPKVRVEENCTSCHTNVTGHQITHFPNEARLCGFCHRASEDHLTNPTLAHVQTLPAEKTCYGCHSLSEKKELHTPFLEGQCSSCHDSHGSSQAKILKLQLPNLCYSCHSQAKFEGVSVHGPISDSKSCLNCHGAHSAESAHLLDSDVRSNCLSCHNKELSISTGGASSRRILNVQARVQMAYPHAPAQTASCTQTCHDPHAAGFENLLRKSFNSQSADYTTTSYSNCFQCHSRTILDGLRTASTNFREDVDGGDIILHHNLHYEHVVIFKASCNACHDPHGSSLPHSIREKQFSDHQLDYRPAANGNGGSCATSCHYGGEFNFYERIYY